MKEEKNNNNGAPTPQLSGDTIDALFDFFPEPVFIIDREGTIILANGAFASRFGRYPEGCLGANVYEMLSGDLFMPELATHRRKMVEEVLHTGKQLFFEDTQDAQVYRSTIYPVRSSEGAITRLLIIAQCRYFLRLQSCCYDRYCGEYYRYSFICNKFKSGFKCIDTT